MTRIPVADDVALYCQDLGKGPAIVLLHGGCMSHRIWESQILALLESGFRVVAPDLRGHGNSEKPVSSYTAEMYAADIAALVDELGIDEFTLVGWSLGATVAATFAGDHADRLNGLVLVSSNIFANISPISPIQGEKDKLPLTKMLANQRQNRPRGMERFVSGMFGGDADEWTVNWLWSIGMQTPMRVAIKTLEIYTDPDYQAMRESLSNFDSPSAVFHGAHDASSTLADAESIARDVLTDGTFTPFEDSGHAPFIEESARFNDELLAFLGE